MDLQNNWNERGETEQCKMDEQGRMNKKNKRQANKYIDSKVIDQSEQIYQNSNSFNQCILLAFGQYILNCSSGYK